MIDACVLSVSVNPGTFARLSCWSLLFLWSYKTWSTVNVQLRVDYLTTETRQVVLNTSPFVQSDPSKALHNLHSFLNRFWGFLFFQIQSIQKYFQSDLFEIIECMLRKSILHSSQGQHCSIWDCYTHWFSLCLYWLIRLSEKVRVPVKRRENSLGSTYLTKFSKLNQPMNQ